RLRLSPKGILELVLNVEEPNTDGCRQQSYRQMHDQEWPNTHEPHHHEDDQSDGCVGHHGAYPRPETTAHQSDRRQPVLYEEQISRAQAKQDKGIAVKPIVELPPAGQSKVFPYGQGRNITNPAFIEVAGARVMNGMAPPPDIVGGQRQHTDRASYPIVASATAKERTVSAVVLYHKEAHQESGGRQSGQQAQPSTDSQGRPGHEPKNCKAAGGYEQLR